MDARPLPHYFSPDHEAYRAGLRDLVEREIAPFVNEWDEAETFPRGLYRKFAELGAPGIGYDEDLKEHP
ncbi:acyl-CoA dehydrogenase family protein [Variovorax sp. PBL-H6]|uniref:acyl-CoA dehydrogenase family protein n=1 Tax=Variovorax sp. PBL-H6 TaxID=434009 RepID=UPI001E61D63F|nr:acyl-CoA dehydrogenase family protein [Variovorax sp. PBL-H6]